ncbi:GspL/Epsl periplasmic domain-containing protein [Dickeya ananatis]|uniref:GspL/Epsl periplasmic domain-containing protein n=1 Tax=Dickeya ananatis TaxID=3061286 RepID=UPI00388D5EED
MTACRCSRCRTIAATMNYGSACVATSYAQMEQFRQQAQAYFQIPPGEMKQEKDHVEGQLTLRSQP